MPNTGSSREQNQLVMLNIPVFLGHKMFLHNEMREAHKKNPHGYMLLDTHFGYQARYKCKAWCFPR